MNRAAHCKECLEKMGDSWDKVHRWLDCTARDYFPWVGHRQIRHHEEGVELIREKWGNEAAEAAEMHIISDEGYVPSAAEIKNKYGVSPFNEDKREYPTYPNKREDGWDGVKELD